MLLTLVTAVNNGGYPTLHHSDRESARAQQEDVDRRTRNSILNAVAALLVQDHEIIAIASHDSSERMGQTEDQPEDQQPDEPQQDQGPRVPYPATHEEEHSFNVNQLNEHFLKLTVVANPKNLDDYFDHANSSDECILAKRGTSFITIAKSGEWDKILSLL
jgi:hypothetical protein